MTEQATRLTADDYEYRLPDHWILHNREPDIPFAHLHAYYVSRVAEIISAAGGSTVLDVGCGDGWAAAQIAKRGLNVVGIDWSPNAIMYANALAPKNAQFFVGDVRDTNFINRFPDKFDAVTFIEVIEHIPPEDCVATLRSISGPLKSGGTLVLTTPSVNYPNTHHNHYRHFTAALLSDIIKDAGIGSIEKIEGYGDVTLENSHYRWARWIDNRYYSIKPALKFLRQRTGGRIVGPTSLDRCHGFIVTINKR